MNAVIVCLDWFWLLVCFGALEAYALGILMRKHEERAYAKQQGRRAYAAMFRRR